MSRLLERQRARSIVRWVLFVGVSWVALRPALLITVSLDDLVNPFSLFDTYGRNPARIVADTSRDLHRNGHFNHVGQDLAALVFVAWTHLISWGVRYSLIYATTKLIVLLFAVVAAARLFRSLAALADRHVELWRSRALVGLVLFATLQIHVPWSLDPVGSFPLFGYLPLAIGLLALDMTVGALQRQDLRSAVLAAAALCGAILYYEINIAIVAAALPVAGLAVLRARRAGQPAAPHVRRFALVAAPATVMTIVLHLLASAANRGYTGTDVDVATGTPAVLARTIAGSVPGAAWGVAADWLDQPFEIRLAALASAAALAAVAAVLIRTSPPQERLTVHRVDVLLLAASPAIVWVGATSIQAVTAKVRAETIGVGYVYNFYAYGSVGLVLAALLLAPMIPWRATWSRARPALLAVALVAVVAQAVINENLQHTFDRRLAPSRVLLAAYSDEAPIAERCTALREWSALPFWQPYFRLAMANGLEASSQHFRGEPFCDQP